MTQLITSIARTRYRLPITPADERHWEIVSYAIGEGDDELDSKSDDEGANQVLNAVLPYLTGEVGKLDSPNTEFCHRMSLLKGVLDSLPESQRDGFANRFREFIEITIRMRKTKSLKEYTDLKSAEGEATIGFFHDVVGDEARTHPNYPKFVQMTNALFRAGIHMDNVIDWPFDFQHALTQISPSVHARVFSVLLALKEIVAVARGLNGSVMNSLMKREHYVSQENRKPTRRG